MRPAAMMVKKIILQGFVTEREIARELECSEQTLRRWRLEGIGPPHSRKGRGILYDVAVVRKWIADGGTPKKAK